MPYSIEQTDRQLVGTSAAIRYTLTFPQAAQHLVHVTIEVDTTADHVVFAMPSWIPGSYKVRDFVSNQTDVRATAPDGTALAMEWLSKSRLRVSANGAGTVRLSYGYYGNERSVRQTHVNRFHAFISTGATLMFVEGRTDEIHHVRIEHPWSRVSTALSPVSDGILGALNYDILADSPIELGDHFTTSYESHGALHEVAITGRGDFDPVWLAQQTRVIIDEAVKMWGPLPYDRYVFIIQLLPGQYGGLEHARSSVNMFDAEVFADKEKTVKLLTLLCHEYFHLWNVKRIRPAELGPFDYSGENYTRMLWLAEGVTSYYDDLMAYRCGFHTKAEYLKALGDEHLGRLLDTPGRLAMSIKDSSYLAWVKLYLPTNDSSNRFPSYYLKGGVIFLLLDLWIIEKTAAAASLDDGMRALLELYRRRPERGVTEEEFIEVVSGAVGVDIGPVLRAWLDAAGELPLEETLGGVGLLWRAKTPPADPSEFGQGRLYQRGGLADWTGLKVDDVRGAVRVTRVTRDSPAEEAGLGLDDEILAVDGYRVSSVRGWDAQLRGSWERRPVKVLAASEGRLYETTLDFRPRPSHELVEREDATPEQRRNLEKWLAH